MKKIYLLIVLIGFNCFAQAPEMEWQKTYGGNNVEYATCIKQTSDGGYILSGTTATNNNGDVVGFWGMFDYWILKLDSSGNMEWQQTLGGNGSEIPWAITETDDGGYLIAGQSDYSELEVTAVIHGSYDFWVVKLDSSGDVLWQKALGGTEGDYIESMDKTLDGGFILAGGTLSNDGDVTSNLAGTNCWVVKIDSLGNIQWQKTYGGSQTDFPYNIVSTSDGGYIFIAGTTSIDGDVSNNHGGWDWWIVKLNGTGSIEWQRSYGGSMDEVPSTIRQTDDGGYIAGGNTQSYDGDNAENTKSLNSWIVKLDITGNIQWKQYLGDAGCANNAFIRPTNDGGYIVTGAYSNGPGFEELGSEDIFVGKLDALGNPVWHKILGTVEPDFVYDVIQTNDGGYALTGMISVGQGGPFNYTRDLWIAKLAPDSLLNTPDFTEANIQIYPNPVKSLLNIQTALSIDQSYIYDISGKIVFQKTGKITEIDTSGLPAGSYILEVKSGNKKYQTKFIKQ